MPTKRNYTRITLYLDSDDDHIAQMLAWIAQQGDRSPSYVVRRLIKAEYERLAGPVILPPSPPDA